MTDPSGEIEVLPEALCEGLVERGCELFGAVRVLGFGERKVPTIKQVKRLNPKLRSIEAKRAVERGAVVLRDVRMRFAQYACARIAFSGGQAIALPTHARLYAYDPRDPRRAAQACLQLTVRPDRIDVREAILGLWVDTEPELLSLAESPLEALDALRRKWAERGLREAPTPLAVHLALAKRNEALERRIAEISEPEIDHERAALVDAARVYADWLLEHDDPRGQVGAAQLEGVDQGPTSFETLTETWAPHLFGPFYSQSSLWKLDWCGPVVVHARLTTKPPFDPHDLVEACLRSPLMGPLRSLELVEPCSDHPRLGAVLGSAPCAASLRELELSGKQVFLQGLSLPRLRKLSLATLSPVRLGLDAPELHTLHSRSGWHTTSHGIDGMFASLRAPKLRHLDLELVINESWTYFGDPLEDQLRALFALPCFAGLVTLRLASSPENPSPLDREFVEIVRAAPMLATLERIDLRKLMLTDLARAELDDIRGELPELQL